MNKNSVYLAVFGVICVLIGVLVGAAITKNPGFPNFNPKRPSFAKRAEHAMWPRSQERKMPRFARGENFLLEMLTDKLDLVQEQQTKVKDILEQTRQEIEKVGKDIREAMDAIKEKGDLQIMEILSPEQQEKFKALLAEFKSRRGHMRPRGEGMPMGPCGDKEDRP